MTHALFEPLTLRELTVKHRIWVPPMCQFSVAAHDGVPNDWHFMHYGALARGGAAAIIVEATGVVPEGRISRECLGLWNDDQRDALARIVSFAHEQGAVMGIQLAHAGRKASTYKEWGDGPRGPVPLEEGGWVTQAPSAIAFPDLATPHALDAAEMDEVVDAFGAAAKRAMDAGFDFVELHAAHGYLLHQFLSPLSNERDDEYGGSLENRSRLLMRVVDTVRQTVGESVPIVVRLSATDWTDGGVTVEETATVAQWLEARGVDMLDISTGGNVLASIPVGPGYQLPHAMAVKAAVTIPVAAVGLIDEPRQAEQIVSLGQADVVLIGREMLRDPNFSIRAARELRAPLALEPEPFARAYR